MNSSEIAIAPRPSPTAGDTIIEDLERECAWWQKVLRLQDWTITEISMIRRWELPNPKAKSKVDWNIQNKTAQISILEAIDLREEDRFDSTFELVKQLVWLHFSLFLVEEDTIAEIAQCQAVHSITQGLVSTSRNSRIKVQEQSAFFTLQELQKKCEYWQKTLRLQDWQVELKFARASELARPTNLGQAHINSTHKAAWIKLLDPIDQQDGDRMIAADHEETLVHELLHLHFDPFMDLTNSARNTAQEIAIEMLAHALVVSQLLVDG
ncbi:MULTISPECIES: hypothetical protein [Trichocoleus]|uniref:Uncharacterized protein n=1 Tax=Trichocoleus desertorum GB2-A4 TaxID=2933944 RepID=A0ABV0JCN6_9CYAN|nr:hypothetical protein [Trichocoleus sp. FACHB-46]MBD1864188.1 hypothetical protein [Trichocoleus sp. FACHB-46]